MPSRYQLFVLWFASHRRYIGWGIGLAAIIVRFNLTFQGHNEVAEHLGILAMLVAAGAAYTAGAGSHNPDEYWKEKKLEATLPPHQRPPRRRKNDIAKPI